MQYNFEVRSIALEVESIAAKHANFIWGLEGAPAPWGVKNAVQAPDPGGSLSAHVSLSKILNPEVKGDLNYQFRRPFINHAKDDDWLSFSFNPEKVNYEILVRAVLPQYLSAFNAYCAEISDDEFLFMDYPEHSKRKLEKRNSLYRLAPVTFMNVAHCRRTLDMSVDEVNAKLLGHVESIQHIANGILFVLTSKPLPTQEMDKVCWSARRLLDK